MSRRSRREIVGFGWSDLSNAGKTAFPYIHSTGAAVLKGFGAGALVAPVTSLEKQGGLLPKDYGNVPPDHIVRNSDFVIVIQKDPGQDPTSIMKPDAVNLFGGTAFAGNGYASGADYGSKFSFGYDAPTGVDVIVQGKKTSFADARQVLLCGGVAVDKQNSKQNITGDLVMSKGIVGTILGAFGIGDDDSYQVGAAPPMAKITASSAVATPINKYLAGTVGSAAISSGAKPVIAAPSFGFQVKTTVKGRQFTSLVPNKTRKTDPKKTLQTTRAIAQRAQQISASALTKIAAAKTVAAKKPVAVVAKRTIMGAATRVLKSPIVKVTASLAALEAEAKKLAAEGKALGTTADKYEKVVNNNVSKLKAGTAQAMKVTGISGFGFEDNEWGEIVGAIGWDEINSIYDGEQVDFLESVIGVYNPSNPGYNLDGTPTVSVPGDMPDPTNPGFLTPSGALDPAYTGSSTSGALASQLPGAPDYGAGTPPAISGNTVVLPDGTTWPQAGVDYMPDPNPNGDDITFYDCPTDDTLPMGAVVYDGSQQPNFQGLGNYTVFFGMLPGGSAAPKGGPHSGYSQHLDGWWLELMGTKPSINYHGGKNYDHVGKVPGTWIPGESQKNNWGPLIGNPQGGWTKGLRFSPSGPNGPRWFWFFDMAPQWAVQGLLQAKLNDAITNYKAAVVSGQTDYVNAELQDKLNAQQAAQQAAAQAATDAQVQQQQEVADSQSAIQQQQLSDQQSAQQQQMYSQQQQQAAQDAQLASQAQALQLQYFQQHPDEIYTQTSAADASTQGGGDGASANYQGDNGGFGGSYADSDGSSDGSDDVDWNSNTSTRDPVDLATADQTDSTADLETEADSLFQAE